VTATTNPARRDQCRAFIEERVTDYVREISMTTRDAYATIMERIWRTHPAAIGEDTQRHLSNLGVDVNDVWIVSVAFEHNLTVLTADAMATIRECVPEVSMENWLV
jgi:predicted nucleic acid-binding protein